MFWAGLGVFFASHFALLLPGFRDALVDRLGANGRRGLIALVSLVGFVALVLGWPDASRAIVWLPPTWMAHVTLALMLPAMVLLVAAYLPAGRIKVWTKHPMLASVKVWAFAHLLANGEVRSIALFGGFLVYAVATRIALKRRGDTGAAGAKPGLVGDLGALVLGGALYIAIVYYLHPILFGVAVIT